MSEGEKESQVKQMAELADILWERYFKQKVQEQFTTTVRYFRATVVTPASEGKIAVQRPFDDTVLHLHFVSNMAGAAAGDQVTCFVFGNGTSASNTVIVGNGQFTQ